MKDLRALLIDCRIELRKLARDFQKSELCERLDLAIQQAANASLPPSPQETAAEATQRATLGKTQTVSQVALAWQTAAQDLKFSDPAIHARLGEKVMRLLAAKTLSDPANEIIQLEGMVKAAEARIAELEKARKAQDVERDTLLGALAQAAPSLKDGGDRLAVGLARVAWLRTEAAKADSGAAPARRAPEPQDTVPTPDLLQAAAAGAATLSKEQREWCVGEAMVVTGFQFTPVELIEKGDAAMARLILEARKG